MNTILSTMTFQVFLQTFGKELKPIWDKATKETPEIVTVDEMTFQDFAREVWVFLP